MELRKGSAGQLCIHGKTRAAVGRSVQVLCRFTEDKCEEIMQLQSLRTAPIASGDLPGQRERRLPKHIFAAASFLVRHEQFIKPFWDVTPAEFSHFSTGNQPSSSPFPQSLFDNVP